MKPLKALLVEDSMKDATLLLRHLSNEGYDVQSEIVQTEADMKAALDESNWDIVLSDYTMPHFTGLDALRVLKKSDQDIPIIIISGTIGEDIAVESMLKGANDYLMKDNLKRLVPAIERDLENAARRRKQKQAEESLRRSEENLANAQRIAHIGSWETDLVNNQLFWSDEVYRIFGVSKELFGNSLESFISFIHPDDRQSVQAAADDALLQNAPYNIEHRIIRLDEEIRIVCEIGEVTFDETGRPIRFIGTVQDITERKRAEGAWRESEMRMQTILETEPECVKVIGLKGELLEMNPAGLAMLEADSIEQVRGSEVINIVAPEHRQAFARLTRNVLDGGTEVLEFEIVGLKGTRRWLETHAVPMRNQTGEITSLLGVTRDITKRKRVEAEKALLAAQIEQQHERLNNIIDNVEGVVWEAYGKPDEAAHKTDFISDYIETMLGYTVEEWLATPNFWLSIVHADDRERMTRVAGENFLKSQSYTEEFRWIAKDGRSIWVETHSTIICDKAGQPIGYRGVNTDVTERKRAEQLIIESEEKYRIIVETANEGIWLADVESVTTYVNRQMAEMLGYTVDEMVGRPIFDFLFEDDFSAAEHKVTQRIKGESETNEFRLRRKDGSEIITQYNGSPIRNQAGEITGLLSMNVDITERKKAEESIRFQAHLLDIVEQSVVATDLNGNVTYWNQFAEKLYGWTKAEAVGRFVMSLTTPEINQKQGNQTIARLRTGKSWAGEFVVQNKAGNNFPAYTSNSPVTDEAGKVIGFVGISFDITERKNAETALREAEDKYRNLVESSPAIAYLSEPNPPYSPIYISPNIAKFGYTTEEWFERPDMWISLIHPEDRAHVLRISETAMQQGLDTNLEYRIIAGDETIHWIQDRGRFVSDEQGNKTGWQGVMLDVTETKVLEEQLRQSQKLESVGLLAGGIAHDFNNMLTAINGYSDLTLRKLKTEDPLRSNIEEIKKAGERSASLTQQLLAFSRQQVLQPVIINLNDVIADTFKMLQRVLGEDIQLTTTLNSKVGPIKADPGQLSQIITNLAINARDAMPQGGTLIVETDNVFLDPKYARRHAGILPGAYVMLAVSDNGSGMSDKTKEHLFEPFFTTKEVGKGTGLGLATVYGIVKQSGGSIEVYSEEGLGTTFKVYLPRIAEQVITEKIKGISAELHKGTETILLVEDEDLVRHLSRQVLEESGYTVIEARNGLHALEICQQEDYKFDLLMTDVVMPQMGGRELAEKLRARLPDIKILFTSGYTDDAVVRHGVIEVDTNFIQKPFSPDKLAEKIREIFDNI